MTEHTLVPLVYYCLHFFPFLYLENCQSSNAAAGFLSFPPLHLLTHIKARDSIQITAMENTNAPSHGTLCVYMSCYFPSLPSEVKRMQSNHPSEWQLGCGSTVGRRTS